MSRGSSATLGILAAASPRPPRGEGETRLVSRASISAGLACERGASSSRVLILNRPDVRFLDKMWRGLHRGRPSDATLIPLGQSELAMEIKNIFEEVGAEKLGIVAYSLRHGGPSWDFMSGFRDLAVIQQRGRWRSNQSVLRYQKSAKLLAAMHQIPPRFKKFVDHCNNNLEALLDFPSLGPALPGRGGRSL